MTPATTPREQASSFAILRELTRTSAPPWRRLAWAAVLGVAGSFATVGLFTGSGYVVVRASEHPGLGAIAGVLAIVEVLAFLRAPLRYGERLVVHDAAFRSLSSWRVWLYNRLEPLAPAGLSRWHRGDLLHRAIDDVDSLQDLYVRGLTPIVISLTSCALALVVVGALLPVAAGVLAIALVVALTVAPAIALTLHRSAMADAQNRASVAADIVDLMEGAPELLAFGHDRVLLARIEEHAGRLDASARRRALVSGIGAAVSVLSLGGAVVGVLALAVRAVRDGRLDPVLLAVLPLAVIAAFESVPAVAAAALHLGDVVAAGRRLLELAERPAPVTDPPSPAPLPEGSGFTFESARLRYGHDLPWALDGLDLAVEPGQRVAVVGPSGAGKSSLLQVLLRYWPLDSGTARLGGTPLDRLDQRQVRRQFALVDHEAHLFAGSLRDNVTLGRPDASEKEIADVMDQAQLTSWVATLPTGLDTPVGEQGTRLSGGQRQRLAVARALLARSPVLLLDEPTAGLDELTAKRLLTDVTRAAGGRTMLVVTHRRQESAAMDRVVEIDGGRVVGFNS